MEMHDVKDDPCGCLHHHTFREGSLGSYDNKLWSENCTFHGGPIPTKVVITPTIDALMRKRAVLEKDMEELELQILRLCHELEDLVKEQLESPEEKKKRETAKRVQELKEKLMAGLSEEERKVYSSQLFK